MARDLLEGNYTIRYIPPHIRPPFLGGVYATAKDINQPILAEPRVGKEKRLIWHITPTGSGQYTITAPIFGSKISGSVVFPGWGLTEEWPRPGEALFLTVNNMKQWCISKETEDENIYTIGIPLPENVMGVSYFVDEQNGSMLVKGVPVVSRGITTPARWEIAPVVTACH